MGRVEGGMDYWNCMLGCRLRVVGYGRSSVQEGKVAVIKIPCLSHPLKMFYFCSFINRFRVRVLYTDITQVFILDLYRHM